MSQKDILKKSRKDSSKLTDDPPFDDEMGRIDESKLFVGLGLPGPKKDVVSSGFWAFAYVRGEICVNSQ